MEGGADDAERQARIISEWSGLEQEGILKMLKQGGLESDFSLTSKINGLIKEEQKKQDEKKKKADEEAQANKIKKIQAATVPNFTAPAPLAMPEIPPMPALLPYHGGFNFGGFENQEFGGIRNIIPQDVGSIRNLFSAVRGIVPSDNPMVGFESQSMPHWDE